MTPLEMIEEARAADKKAVEDFGNRWWGGNYPPIEERLAFVEWRLKLWVCNIASAVEVLAKEASESRRDSDATR